MTVIKQWNGSAWETIVVGKQGPQGLTGPQGVTGPQGAQGPQGAGVPTGGTIGQALVKSSGTNYDTQWASVGSAARPLLTGGAYLSGSGLVLSGLSGNYASAPDSAALSITGDIDIKVKVALTDWTPASETWVAGKWATTGNQRSYLISVATDGKLRFRFSDNGTNNIDRTSTVATGFTDGATKWIRATLDVNNGASGHDVKFYTSDNGTTWTQLGTTITNAGTTSVFDGTALLEFGSINTGSVSFAGTLYDVIIQSAYDTADNTTSLVFDANFETATADALAFTESSANAATVTINTTRYSWGAFASPLISQLTTSTGANLNLYSPFTITTACTVDMYSFDVTTAPTSTSTVRAGIYATTADMQPTGAPLVDVGTITVNTGVTGVYHKQFTPVTLQPGTYVTLMNATVSIGLRGYRAAISGGIVFGASSFLTDVYSSQTLTGLPTNPNVWNTRSVGTTPIVHYSLWRWKAA